VDEKLIIYFTWPKNIFLYLCILYDSKEYDPDPISGCAHMHSTKHRNFIHVSQNSSSPKLYKLSTAAFNGYDNGKKLM